MCTTIRTCDDSVAECCSCGRAIKFLSRYCAALLGCGSTCLRLEKNASRIARRFGLGVEVTIFPRHLSLTVRSGEESVTEVVSVEPRPISYDVNTQLSQLSWEVADRHLPLEECEGRMETILSGDSQKDWVTLVLVPIANASFCRLFGGDWMAMLVVAFATLAGYQAKQILSSMHADPRVIFIACGFISSVLACAGLLFHLGSTPGIALGASVLYLVPGIPFLNSFSDLLNRHYICAFSRFADACVLTACLSGGLGLGLWLMHQSVL